MVTLPICLQCYWSYKDHDNRVQSNINQHPSGKYDYGTVLERCSKPNLTVRIKGYGGVL